MKYVRLTVDLFLTALMPVLMAFAVTGFRLHELLGTVLFVLVILHNALNAGWYARFFAGRWVPARLFGTAVNLSLVILMILLAVSGYGMTGRISVPAAWAHRVHLVASYWCYVLLCLHAGAHLRVPFSLLKKRDSAAYAALLAAVCTAAVCGVYAFLRQGFPGYLSGTAAFAGPDSGGPRRFFADYTAVMALFMLIGAWIVSRLRDV
ncbi:MAG: hypothetical protein J5758_01635 [Abditibacteriota bacterium]|nr:hypothetical protein [Abditibacteriota bacterium]